MTKDEKKKLELLKAYFTTVFMNGGYTTTSGGCETCGYGGTECMDLETIYETIDTFIKKKGKV